MINGGGLSNTRWRNHPEYHFHARPGGILYTEGDHQAVIGGDPLMGRVSFVIYPNQFRGWKAPHNSELLSDEKKAQIMARLDEWFAAQNLLYEVDTRHI